MQRSTVPTFHMPAEDQLPTPVRSLNVSVRGRTFSDNSIPNVVRRSIQC